MACTEIAVACFDTLELSGLLHLLFTHTTMCSVKSALEEITEEQYEGTSPQIPYLRSSLIIYTPDFYYLNNTISIIIC